MIDFYGIVRVLSNCLWCHDTGRVYAVLLTIKAGENGQSGRKDDAPKVLLLVTIIEIGRVLFSRCQSRLSSVQIQDN